MRAISYTRFGSADDVLCEEDIDIQKPGSGEVLIRLHASGINPTDIKLRAGKRAGVRDMPYPKIIPHGDGAGIIEEIGDGVSQFRVGQRVWVIKGQYQRPHGTAAQYITLSADNVFPLPDNQSFEVGAGLGIPAFTAWKALHGGAGGLNKVPVDGQTILVSGGAGTVGRQAIQLAKAGGARVLATARGQAAVDDARMFGASDVFDYTSPDLAAQIMDATGGKLVDRIIEPEFGVNAKTNAQIIAQDGVIAAYGSAKDHTPVLPFYPLMFKGVTLELVVVYNFRPELLRLAGADINAQLERGALTSPVHKTFDLSECARAHDMVETGGRLGAVVLTM